MTRALVAEGFATMRSPGTYELVGRAASAEPPLDVDDPDGDWPERHGPET